jgi:hypothetical protein
MSFGFLAMTDNYLGETDLCVSAGQIWIERQCTLTLSNAFSGAVSKVLNSAHQ